MKTVTIDWDPAAERFVAEGSLRGQTIDINAPRLLPQGEGRHGPAGFSASELLLAGAGACAAWDVVAILRKQRQDVVELQVRVDGEQEVEAPWPYRDIVVHFTVRGRRLDPRRIRRAVDISIDRYCSVIATVRGLATVTGSVTIVEVDAAPIGILADVVGA